MKLCSDPVAYEISDDPVTERRHISINGIGNIIKMISCFCHFNPFKKALSRNLNQLCSLLTDLPDAEGARHIGMISFVDQSGIQADDIALLQNKIIRGNPMHHFIIDGYADRSRIAVIVQEIRLAAMFPDQLLSQSVDILRGNSGADRLLHLIEDILQQFT